MNAIFERTSVRQYKKEEATPEQIETILRAGFCAPSAGNKQSWKLIIVKGKKRLEELSHFSPYASVMNTMFRIYRQ